MTDVKIRVQSNHGLHIHLAIRRPGNMGGAYTGPSLCGHVSIHKGKPGPWMEMSDKATVTCPTCLKREHTKRASRTLKSHSIQSTEFRGHYENRPAPKVNPVLSDHLD